MVAGPVLYRWSSYRANALGEPDPGLREALARALLGLCWVQNPVNTGIKRSILALYLSKPLI
jgi:hypothetical protein